MGEIWYSIQLLNQLIRISPLGVHWLRRSQPVTLSQSRNGSHVQYLSSKARKAIIAQKPCRTFTELFNKEGSKVTLKIFPKSNHHFSHNGQKIVGIAFNGCEDNPVILRFNGKHTFLDGNPADKAKVRWQKCFTQRGGSGKTYEDFNEAISSVIDFFDNS